MSSLGCPFNSSSDNTPGNGARSKAFPGSGKKVMPDAKPGGTPAANNALTGVNRHGNSWQNFRHRIMPNMRPGGTPAVESIRRIPPEFEKYMEGLAPFLLQAISGNDLRVFDIYASKSPKTVTEDGCALFVPDKNLASKFGAKNIDEAAIVLNAMLRDALNIAFREQDQSGFQAELRDSVKESRATNGDSPFPIFNGIGTAVDTTILSFAALLKLCQQRNLLSEDRKEQTLKYHGRVVHGLTLLHVNSLVAFDNLIKSGSDCRSLIEFYDNMIPPTKSGYRWSKDFTIKPWNLNHLAVALDDNQCAELVINPNFNERQFRIMTSDVEKAIGCPYKRFTAPLVNRMLDLAWEVMAVPLILGEIKAEREKQG
jgi:hypothetical protein